MSRKYHNAFQKKLIAEFAKANVETWSEDKVINTKLFDKEVWFPIREMATVVSETLNNIGEWVRKTKQVGSFTGNLQLLIHTREKASRAEDWATLGLAQNYAALCIQSAGELETIIQEYGDFLVADVVVRYAI